MEQVFFIADFHLGDLMAYQAWAGLTAREYKNLKGLHQENLRDNMTNEELVMNMLAELTTTNITKEDHPQTMSEHARASSA